MAHNGLPLFIYSFLILALLGCNQSGVSIKKGDSVDNADVVITSPLNSAFYSLGSAQNIIFQGTCDKDGDPITVTSGAISQQTVCAGNLWAAALDLSTYNEGAYQILASNPSYTTSVLINIQTPPTPRVIFTSPVSPTGFFDSTFTMTWLSVGNLSPTNSYYVEAFTDSNCTGTPFASGYQNTNSYSFTGLIVGTYYSLRVRGYNTDNISGNPVCSASILSDSTIPVLTMSDPTTLSTTYARQATAKVSMTTNVVALKYCVSETITVAPAFSNSCFKNTKPTSVVLSAGEGVKTVYLWLADNYGHVLPTPSIDTIIVDSISPATPTLVVTDPNTMSTTSSSQALNDLAITNDTGAVAWCLYETVVGGTVQVPAFDSPCFSAVKPIAVTLGGKGARQIHVFTVDIAGNVSAQALLGFTWLIASSFTMTADPFYLHPTVCLPIVFKLKDANGKSTNAGPAAFKINLTKTSGTGAMYSNSTCTISTTSLTISTGTFGTIYYKTNSDETFTLDGASTLFPAVHIIGSFSAVKRNAFILSPYGQSCYIKDGIPQCWGLNNGTYFGRGLSRESTFIQPTGKRASTVPPQIFTDLSVGFDHNCAIKSGGATVCWGQNFYGQLGTGTYTNATTMVAVPTLSTATRAVAAGNKFSCALLGDRPKCWGINDHGQLGDGTTNDSPAPQDVILINSNVSKIQASDGFACALRSNGSLFCWGRNDKGQLGNGTTIDSPVPTSVLTLNQVNDFSLGETWACASAVNGVKCWGTNYEAGLGDGSTFASSTPVDVSGTTAAVTYLTVGKSHACVVKAGVYNCWGKNNLGQFGNGSTSLSYQATPVVVAGVSGVAQISSGRHTTCMINTTNAPSCWGSNANNLMGVGTFANSAVPVTATGLTGTPVALSVGSTTCVTMSNGTNQCWGKGSDHQIGDGSNNDSSTPLSSTASTSTVISTGELSTCSVNSNRITCWGTNINLRLGQPASTTSSNAVNVQGIASGASSVHVSKTGMHACAVVSGGVKCWGNNEVNQLGIPYVNDDEDTPVYVTGLGAGSGVTKVVSGNNHSCALVNNSVQCWGDNEFYQLGKGPDDSSEEAPIVTIASGATDLSTAGNYNCAVVSGALKCWGTLTIYGTMNVPTIHPDLTSNVLSVASGEFHTCVIMTTGTVRCFGQKGGGKLGNNLATADNIASVVVTGITSATAIDASSTHTCAIDGSAVKCWGYNFWGAMSDGTPFATTIPVSPTLEP